MSSFIVSSGQVSSGLTLSNTDSGQVLSGGNATQITMLAGGQEFVSLGGTDTSATISNGGIQHVEGGIATSATILGGGSQTVSSGGVASATVISSGGSETLSAGGVDSGAIVRSGGVLQVLNSGFTSGAVVSAFGSLTVASGGRTSGVVLNSGGREIVSSGAVDISGTILSGAELDVFGVASGTLNSGYFEEISAGGVAISARMTTSTGEMDVYAGGTVTGSIADNGGEVLLLGGTATGTVLNSGGSVFIDDAGSIAVGTIVNNGAIEYVDTGVASSTVVNSGGQQLVFATASNTTINIGGSAVVETGGKLSNGAVSGQLIVSSGGTTINTGVGGGLEKVLSGGVVTSAVLSGGTIELADGAVVSGAVFFAGGSATLQIDGATMPTAPISGATRTDAIDIRSLAWNASTSATYDSTAGTLTVTNGTTTDVLTVSGVGNISRFQTASDSNGGTLVTGVNEIKWTNAAGGSWTDPSNWSTNTVPGGTDDVVIDIASTYTVSVTGAQSAGTLTIAAPGATVSVADNQTLNLLGAVVNSGSIVDASAGNDTWLVVNAAQVKLSGGGVVTLSEQNHAQFFAATAGNALDNVDNAIQGTGRLGKATNLIVTNEAGGTINANSTAGALIVDTTAGVTNKGLMEATGGGSLVIRSAIANSGGTILANASTVTLNNGAVSGGTLVTSNAGQINVSVAATLDGSASAVTNSGSVFVPDNQTLNLLGTMVNSGTITDNSLGNDTWLVVNAAQVTLSGGGVVTLTEQNHAQFFAATAGNTLDNVDNAIQGTGRLGKATNLVVTNEAGGTINANSKAGGLIVDTAANVTNKGLMEATGGGSLVIRSAIANSGGFIVGNGGTVTLDGGSVGGGSLVTSGSSQINVTGAATLDGSASAVTNSGSVFVLDNQTLNLLGAMVNSGTITDNSLGNDTWLVVNAAQVTLSGGGVVTLTEQNHAQFFAATAGNALDNVDNAIQGAGRLGKATNLIVTNEAGGTINANSTAGALIVDTTAGVTNKGLMEATGGGSLVIRSAIANSGGTILANASTVTLNNGAVSGGTLVTSNAGQINVSVAATLDGSASAVTNSGSVFVPDNQTLNLLGTMVNSGTITDNSLGNDTWLVVNAAQVTLSGGGVVTLTEQNHAQFFAATAGNALDNVDNAIQGTGRLGKATNLIVTNEAGGTINANSKAGGLIVDTAATVTNKGLMEATGGGSLVIRSAIANSGGFIVGNGGTVTLDGGSVSGGTLVTSSGSQININLAATLDGSASALTNKGSVNVLDGQTLNLAGTIVNGGTITDNSAGNDTRLIVNAAKVSLSGGGVVTLTEQNHALFYTAAAANILDNVDNTIQGTGHLGNVTNLILTNEAGGTINANSTAGALFLDTAAFVINKGLIEATGAGSLSIPAAVTNIGGTIAADGGTVTIDSGFVSGGTLLTSNGGQINVSGGGRFDGSGNAVTIKGGVTVLDGQALSLLGTIVNSGTIKDGSAGNDTWLIVNSAKVTLSGGGAVTLVNQDHALFYTESGGFALDNIDNAIQGTGRLGAVTGLSITNEAGGTINANSTAGALILDTTATVVNKGLMEATGGGSLVIRSAVANSGGTIAANGGAVTLAAGASIAGFGSITGGIDNEGLLDAANGKLVVAGTVTGAGSAAIENGATLELGGADAQQVSFATTAGTLILDQPSSFTGKVNSFQLGDAIDLQGIGLAASFTYASGLLTLKDSSGNQLAQITVASTAPTFRLGSDGSGGTTVTGANLPASPGFTQWTNISGGSFTNIANWSNGFPEPGIDALIGLRGSYAVTLTGFSAARSLTIADPSAVFSVASNPGTTPAGFDTQRDFNNAGFLQIDANSGSGGSTLNIVGTLNSTNSIQIGPGNNTIGAQTTVNAGALQNTGRLLLFGGTGSNANRAVLNVGSAAPSVLTGDNELSGRSLIEFASGSIGAIATNATLTLTGPNAIVADASDTSSNTALAGLSKNAGNLNLLNGTRLQTSGDLTNTGNIAIDTSFGGGSIFNIGGTLSNTSTTQVGSNNLSSATTVTAGGLANTGRLFVQGGTGTNTTQATLNVAAAAPSALNGDVELSGQSLIEFAAGSIATLTSGSRLVLSGPNARIADAADTTGNSALTGFSSNFGSFELLNGKLELNGDFTNNNSFAVDDGFITGGSTVSIAGTLTNTSSTVIGSGNGLSAPTLVTAGGFANTGRLILQGSTGANINQATLNIAAAAPTALNGDVELSGQSMIEFAGGSIGTLTKNSRLVLNGPNARIADAADTTGNSALTGFTANFGAFELLNGKLELNGDFTNNNSFAVDDGFLTGGSTVSIAGTLTNASSTVIGSGNGLSAPTLVTAGGFANTGRLILQGGTGTNTNQATLNIEAAAPTVLYGDLELSGRSLLEFAGGSVSSIAGGGRLILNGPNALIADASDTSSSTALTGFSSNAGDFEISNGNKVQFAGDVFNAGTFFVDTNFGGGGSRVDIAGTLSNTSSVQIGTTAITAASTVNAGGLANSGRLILQGGIGGNTSQATLNVAAAAPTTLNGDVELYGHSLLDFGAGSITNVASGATLILSGPNALLANAADTASNSALTGLGDNYGRFELQGSGKLQTTGDFDNAGSFFVDLNFGNGGSTVTFGGVFGNTSTVRIGNSALSAATAVNAAALDNNATLILQGGTGSTLNRASINITGAAPGILNGDIQLSGRSTIDFGAGSITGLASGARLTLNGADALIADASDLTSNSALTGFTNNAGTFQLQGNQKLQTTGDFNNAGTFSVDTTGLVNGSIVTIGGVLGNTGTTQIGTTSLTGATTVNAAGLANTGRLLVEGGSGGNTGLATLNIAGTAPGTLSGDVELFGHSLLEFGAGIIQNNTGHLYLFGANALVADASDTKSNSALTGLQSNSGELQLHNGVSVTLTGDFTNLGSATLDANFGDANSTLTVQGGLSNDNYLQIGGSSLSGTTTVSAGSLANAGLIRLFGGAGSTAGQEKLVVTGALVTSGTISATSNSTVIAGSLTVVGGGLVSLASGASATAAVLSAGGLEVVSSGSVASGATIAGGTLELAGGIVSAATIDFTGMGGTLQLDTNTMPTAAVTGFVPGDTIDFRGLTFVASATATYDSTTQVLTVTNGGNVDKVTLTGIARGTLFGVANDGRGGTAVTARTTGSTLWTNSAGGNWITAGNWSNGVPGSGIDAVIGIAGSYVVTLTAAATAKTVTIDDPNATLRMSGTAGVGSGSLAVQGDLVNFGGVTLDAGGTGGGSLTVGGTLTNTNNFSIGNSNLAAATTATVGNFVNTGALVLTGNSTTNRATLNVAAGAPALLVGNISLNGNALLEFGGSASIAGIGTGITLDINGAKALLAAAGVDLNSNSALANLGSIGGTLLLRHGASVTTNVDLANTANLLVDSLGGQSGGGSTLNIDGVLNNSSIVTIGVGDIVAPTNVTAANLVNTGTLNLTGNTSNGSPNRSTLNIASGAPGQVVGTFNLAGNALLEFGGAAGVTSIASTGFLDIDGKQAFLAAAGIDTNSNSALDALNNVAGTFRLRHGASVSTAGDVSNTGSLLVDGLGGQGGGGSTLNVGGVLKNASTLTIGVGDMVASTTVTAANLVNTGTLNLTGNTTNGSPNRSTLNVAAGAPSQLVGTINLAGNALLEFGGAAGVASIASTGFLDIDGKQAFLAAAGIDANSNSALDPLSNIAGTLRLRHGTSAATAGDLTNTGNLLIDSFGGQAGGGSSLDIGGTLINAGQTRIGISDIIASSTVHATDLANTGTLLITGGTGSNTNQGKLNIDAGAPGILNGDVELFGHALLEFGNGSIQGLANGARLFLTTQNALIANAGDLTTNSALTGFSTNAGDFELHSAAPVQLAGNLTNTGTLRVDTNGSEGGTTLAVAGKLTTTNFAQFGATGPSAATTVTAADYANTGQVLIEGGIGSNVFQTTVNIAAGAPGVMTGNTQLFGHSLLEFGSGSIASLASGATLIVNGPNALVANAADKNSNSALTGISSNAGDFELQGGAKLQATGAFTNTGTYRVDSTSGGSTANFGGVLTNAGTTQIGNVSLNGNTLVTAPDLANTGTLFIQGGSGSNLNQATLNIAAAAPATLQGDVELTGRSLLEFGTGSITGLATGARLVLSSANALIVDAADTKSNSALTGFASNAGRFELQNGPQVQTTGPLSNTGTLLVDSNGGGGSKLTIGGALTNSNSVQIGTTSLSANTTLTASSLANTGSLFIEGGLGSNLNQATLNVTGAAPGTLGGSLLMFGHSLLEFASGSIGTLAAGGRISLNGANGLIADAGQLGSNSGLSGLANIAGSFDMHSDSTGVAVAGDLDITGSLSIDTNFVEGGSLFSVGGTLTNASTITIGNSGLNAATTLTAGAFANTGQITVFGSGTTKKATLSVTGAGTNAGSISILAGGVVSGKSLSVQSGGTVTVFSGGTAAGVVAGLGGTETVSSGGIVSGAVISGGTLVLVSGANVATPITFSGTGGSLQIEGTTMPTNTIVGFVPGNRIDLHGASSGSTASVSFDSSTHQLTVTQGGTFTLNLDPTQDFTGNSFFLGNDGQFGTEIVVVSGALLVAGGNTRIVSAGETASGLTVLSGAGLIVQSGGTVLATVVDSGGKEVVSSGGVDSGTTISGGEVDLFGIASATLVGSGGIEIVGSGGTASDATVNSGGTLELLGGGAMQSPTFRAGATLAIGSGAAITGATATSGVRVAVLSGGALSASIVNGGGAEVVSSGGATTNPVLSGGLLELAAGAVASGGITFSGSALLQIDGTTMPTAAISGFAAGDSIDLPNVGATAIAYSGGVLTLFNKTTQVAQLTVTTPYANPGFTETRDSTGGTLITVSQPAAPDFTYVTNFAKTNVIQTGLIKEFPSGIFTGNPGLTVPFDIEPDSSGNNYSEILNSLTMNVSIPNVTHIYTLLQAYSPPPGATGASVEFIGSQGTTQTFNLVYGDQLRDFYQDGFANSINGTTTKNAFTISGVQDAAATGNVNTGLFGTYLIDEQDFVLDPAFANQTLQQIVFTNLLPNTNAVPVLLGLTAQTVSAGQIVSSGQTLVISAGGSADGLIVQSGGTLIVLSGGSVTNTVDGGDEILSGGIDSAGTVGSDGVLTVSSGGLASGTTINNGGSATVESGGTASATVVNAGGSEFVSAGGVAFAAKVSGGEIDVDGVASGTTLDSGGRLYVGSGGAASGTTLRTGSTETVLSGGIDNGATLVGSGTELDDFGTVIGTTVGSASRLEIFSGGIASGAIVNNSGRQDVGSGGIASGTTVNSGGYDRVDGTEIGATVHAALEDVFGTASGAILDSGSVQDVQSGGLASGTTLTNAEIRVSGSALGTIVDSGGSALIESGGVDSGTIVNNGGAEIVTSGGTASGTTVNSGGEIVLANGGVQAGTVLNPGGALAIVDGYVLNGYSVTNGTVLAVGFGAANLASGGATASALGTTVNSGTEIIGAGGVASGTIVNSGGVERILSGGLALGTTVNTSGSEVISAGGFASGTILDDAATQSVFGSASNTVVSAGDTQIVQPGGLAVGTTVSSGGLQTVSSGSTARTGLVASGGKEQVLTGGTDVATTVSGGEQDVVGSATGAVVSSGLQVVGAGGVAAHTVLAGNVTTFDPLRDFSIANGNPNGVWSYKAGAALLSTPVDGTASGTLAGENYWWNNQSLPNSAIVGQNVTGGTRVFSNTVVARTDYLDMDPQANPNVAVVFTAPSAGTYLAAGNFLGLDTGEHAHHVEIRQNAIPIVSGVISAFGQSDPFSLNLNLAAGDTVAFMVDTGDAPGDLFDLSTGLSVTIAMSGGAAPAGTATQVVQSGGTANNTIIGAGNAEMVGSGGSTLNPMIAGGTLELGAGATTIGAIAFVGSGGTLQLDDNTAPVPIAGFAPGDSIDLRALPFDPTNTVGFNAGTLTVSGGGISDALSLIGVSPLTNFVLGSDGKGGTLVSGTAVTANITVSSGQTFIVNTGENKNGIAVLFGGTLIVSSGGVASGTADGGTENLVGGVERGGTVFAGGVLNVSSGGLASGTTVSSGGFENVSAGGVASNTNAVSGGALFVSSGGITLFTTLAGSGFTTGSEVLVGGTASATTVSSGGVQFISAGGVAVGTVVSDGGAQTVSSGGIASNSEAISGGFILVSSGGSTVSALLVGSRPFDSNGGRLDSQEVVGGAASATTVSSGGLLVILSGGLASASTILSGGTEAPDAGGVSLSAVISAGGAELVENGGVASSATVLNDGVLEVLFAGSVDSAVVISSGGVVLVGDSGATDIGATVSSGGKLEVLSGGVASGATVLNGGLLVVGGGVDSAVVISSGGAVEVRAPGATDIGATVSSGGELKVSSGGVASGATVLDGGLATVGAGGVGSNTSFVSGGQINVSAGGLTVSSVVTSSGAAQRATEVLLSGGIASADTVSNGGLLSAATVSNGGLLNVLFGGVDRIATISVGGVVVVSAGGLDLSATVLDGGLATISSGGIASGMQALSGGQINVSAGGTTVSSVLLGSGSLSGAVEQLFSGAVGSATTVSSGGILRVFSGGQSIGDTVLDGGIEFILASGIASGARAVSGGQVNVLAGGKTVSGVLLGSGAGGRAAEQLLSGAVASATTVSSGGQLNVSSGGVDSAAVVSSGGLLAVSSGGIDIGASVGDGGLEVVSAGGLASGAKSVSGGQIAVSAGGLTVSSLVLGSGASQRASEQLFSGGIASATTVSSGGVLIVSSGGADRFAVVSSGGALAISAGGVDSAATIGSGGSAVVSSGGTAVDVTISGGTAEMAVGGALVGTTKFVGSGGRLQIDGTVMPSTVIAGFVSGVTIDLRSIAGGAAGSASLDANKLLTVTEGGKSFQLQLDASALNETFILADDSLGGTVISAVSGLVVLPGQTLVVSAGQVLSGITVLSGGTLQVVSGATVIGATIGAGGKEIVAAGAIDISATISSGGFQDLFGTASGTLIIAGGSQTVETGALADSTILDDAATQTVFGTALNTVVSASDIQIVEPGGVASGTIISSGGTESVLSAGRTVNTTVSAGGVLNVSFGGVASATTIGSGGLELVLSAGTTVNTTIAGGGTLELANAGKATGTIAFVGKGGLLQIDGGPMPSAAITGFVRGDLIDLRGLPPNAANTAKFDAATGVLTVSGAVVDTLTFQGLPGNATFALSDDGRSGTLVKEVAPAPSALTLLPASDSGVVGDNITNVTTPTITGSGEVGDVVTLFEGSTLVGASTVLGTGTWSVKTGQLTAGNHSFTALETDPAGNASPLSTGLTIRIDTAAPQTIPASLTVAGIGSATSIGIAAPGDSDDAAAALAIAVAGLPNNGTVTLADGTTPVTVGQPLTIAQLTGLKFAPVSGHAGSTSAFSYTVSDPAGNVTVGNANLSIGSGANLFSFVFTYNDGKDYYRGTVADDGSFGYSVGLRINTTQGHYDIFAKDASQTTQPSGAVSVSYYSHSEPGQGSPTPVLTGQGKSDGSKGLGTESDTILDTLGQPHPFSATQEASIGTTTQFGFVFTYADNSSSFSGVTTDDGSFGLTNTSGITTKTVFDSSGNVIGTYQIFPDGVATFPPGSVVVQTTNTGGTVSTPTHSSTTGIDGTKGLGSERTTVTVGGSSFTFSSLQEPTIPVTMPTVPVLAPPSAADIVTNELTVIYHDLLGRDPDPSGLATYSSQLAGGTSLGSIRQTLAQSPEAQSDINQLYNQIFGRDVDSSGLSTYTSALVNGSSLSSVRLILAQSTEAQNDINQLYQQLLGRDADGAGLAAFVGGLAAGGSLSDVRSMIAHSPEEQSNLLQLFQTAIGRTPNAAELVGAEERLTGGATFDQVKTDLSGTGSAGGFTIVTAPSGDAALAAQAGVPTLFAFADIGLGNDTIAGFDPMRDAIQLPKSRVPDLSALQSDISSANAGTLITLGSKQSITLTGVSTSSLTASNFQLV